MNHCRATHDFRWLTMVVLIGGIALLLSGCEFFGGEESIAREVKEETGVDINSPSQVAGAALGASVLGNEDQEDGLTVLRGYRRAQHEQKGDEYAVHGKTDLAREEYREALKWTNTGNPAGQTKAANLEGRIASSYSREADEYLTASLRNSDPVTQASLADAANIRRRRSAASYGQAADREPDPIRKSSWYLDQAEELLEAKDHKAGCAVLRKASKLDGSIVDLARYEICD